MILTPQREQFKAAMKGGWGPANEKAPFFCPPRRAPILARWIGWAISCQKAMETAQAIILDGMRLN